MDSINTLFLFSILVDYFDSFNSFSSRKSLKTSYMSNTHVHTGIDLTGVLFIVFLILKLTNVIDWSWWWVTAPLWGPIALAFAIIVVLFLFGINIFNGRY
jgi:phosphoglycerol transferase MdoB-like AlkP superfamily enzyme